MKKVGIAFGGGKAIGVYIWPLIVLVALAVLYIAGQNKQQKVYA